jgi:hypothetical protein
LCDGDLPSHPAVGAPGADPNAAGQCIVNSGGRRLFKNASTAAMLANWFSRRSMPSG